MNNAEGPPRATLIAASVLAVGAIGVILVLADRSHPRQHPVTIAAVGAPRAQSPACRALLEELPAQLGDYQRAPTTQPTPAGTAAWRADGGGEPVVLRCGLDRPADFVVSSPIQVVDAVQWLRSARMTDPRGMRSTDRSMWRSHCRRDRDPHLYSSYPSSSTTPWRPCRSARHRLSASPPHAPTPYRPWSPTTWDSPRRWPPTSAGTSRSW